MPAFALLGDQKDRGDVPGRSLLNMEKLAPIAEQERRQPAYWVWTHNLIQ